MLIFHYYYNYYYHFCDFIDSRCFHYNLKIKLNKLLGNKKTLLFNILTATVELPFTLWTYSTVAFATCPNAPFPMTFTILILSCANSHVFVIETIGMLSGALDDVRRLVIRVSPPSFCIITQ